MLPPRPLSVIPTDELVLLDVANDPHTAHPITPSRISLSYLLMKVGFSMSSYQEIMAEQERQRRSAESAAARRAEARADDESESLRGIRDSLEKRVRQAEEAAQRADARALSAAKQAKMSFWISVIAVAVSVIGIIVSALVR